MLKDLDIRKAFIILQSLSREMGTTWNSPGKG